MTLSNFSISPVLETYKRVSITAAHGTIRISVHIRPEELDDLFPNLQFTDQGRISFAIHNIAALQCIISDKYKRGEWEPICGSAARRIEIDLSDLTAGLPLLDVVPNAGNPPAKIPGLRYEREKTRDRIVARLRVPRPWSARQQPHQISC
ncbi:MAG TPA: hypothetical protein VM689_25560 [Aliidongia sp.]|nr:hypothetical protein [Aliidongia sp.]